VYAWEPLRFNNSLSALTGEKRVKVGGVKGLSPQDSGRDKTSRQKGGSKGGLLDNRKKVGIVEIEFTFLAFLVLLRNLEKKQVPEPH